MAEIITRGYTIQQARETEAREQAVGDAIVFASERVKNMGRRWKKV